MKASQGAVVGLLILATCNGEVQKGDLSTPESARAALGVSPPSEVAVWQKVGSTTTPDGRYLQAAAFDETRQVVVMFGGTTMDPNSGTTSPNKETWEWSPATGKWTARTGTGVAPDARSGAAMVFDSARGKFVLFGGRAGSGFNYEDTWEWDPTTGVWTDVSAAGGHPSARCQAGMVYEKSTAKILLFGGGRSDSASYDATGMSVSMGDTWEYDPVTHLWTARTVTSAPTARHDLGLVWDSSRNKAVLFAGMQSDIAGAAGVPKQDTWEWDPVAGTWTERTISGSKPSQRYGHAMAFDATRKKIVVFGGSDISTGASRNDLWDWEPTTGAWVEILDSDTVRSPSGRMYASMVSDDAHARLEIIAGEAPYGSSGGGGRVGSTGPIGYGVTGSREVWELAFTGDPELDGTTAFTDRTAALDVPAARYGHAMVYNPSTGKTYVFGGYDSTNGQAFNDLWEWDGKIWAQVASDVLPPVRTSAGLGYDPIRKSLILYGGVDANGMTMFDDTWEWGSSRKWTQLKTVSSPGGLFGHGMVTDTTRNKILLFGGMNYTAIRPPVGGGPIGNPISNQVWEWDGGTMAWTNRTPPATTNVPAGRQFPVMAYDEGRQKLFLYDGLPYGSSMSSFWEWDPLSAGWTTRDSGDSLNYGYDNYVAYDSIRRREVILPDSQKSSGSSLQTWEVDANGPTWYVRTLASTPGTRYSAAMTFDKGRGVVVLFGGESTTGSMASNDTWEYKVTSLGNGEGCNAAFASACATGFCVDGVCCEAAACSGACKSCNVAGLEGTCVLAKAGTEVPGSCSAGLACDGSGSCMAKNGQACISASTCASGFCADGVCCDSACTGACASCTQAGLVGKCSPYAAGTDPQNECGQGAGVCKSTCDGVGSCAYAGTTVSCGNCQTCNGIGTCSNYDPYCGGSGGKPDPSGGSGGSIPNVGGSGGYTPGNGGSGGSIPNVGGSGGYTPGNGGSGGSIPNVGGSGGYLTSKSGSGGFIPNVGGSGGNIPNLGGSGGFIPSVGGSDGAIPNVGGSDGAIANIGGSGGTRDGGVGDVSTVANLHKSGCSCEVGNAESSDSGLSTPLLVAGVALLLMRKRRR
jgi:hypothetical protein